MTVGYELFKKRRAGVILHPTSLPGTPGNGDLGKSAYRFVDFLVECGLSLWQMLPLGPPHEDLSPYQCQSADAANPLLINLEDLVERGWLAADPNPPTDYLAAVRYRHARLRKARQKFVASADAADREAFADFVAIHADWLEDYALFKALQAEHHGAAWWDWLPAYRDRNFEALEKARARLAEVMEQHRFEQFLFFGQWQALRHYANERGVYLFGDIPIFVAEDSVDVWANRENFLLDEHGRPTVVAGVPPDYFSETGQRWGNPHYNWEYMQTNGFQWWLRRLQKQSLLFDLVRIDHFRGFEACWAVPASSEYAIEGEWVKVPGAALFETLRGSKESSGQCTLPLVAEDLGVITDDVVALRDKFGLPGMRVLQFGFDGAPGNPHVPHNYVPHCVVYTGTHDNNTTLGWFKELPTPLQHYVCEYLHAHPYDMPWPMIEAALASVAKLVMIPMQDILAADSDQRMNTPGTPAGNWQWRLDWERLPFGVKEKLRRFLKFYERI